MWEICIQNSFEVGSHRVVRYAGQSEHLGIGGVTLFTNYIGTLFDFKRRSNRRMLIP
jgi:hypothetical protein